MVWQIRTCEYIKKGTVQGQWHHLFSSRAATRTWFFLLYQFFSVAACVYFGELFACQRLSWEKYTLILYHNVIHSAVIGWISLKGSMFKHLLITEDNWPPRKGCMGNLNCSYSAAFNWVTHWIWQSKTYPFSSSYPKSQLWRKTGNQISCLPSLISTELFWIISVM